MRKIYPSSLEETLIAARKKNSVQELLEDIANLPRLIAEHKKLLIGLSGVFAFVVAMPILVIASDHLPTISDTAGTYIACGTLFLVISIAALAYKFIYSKKE